MSDHSSEKTSSRTITPGRALVAGVLLLATGITLGVLVGQTSGTTLASAPRTAPGNQADLLNVGEPSSPLATGQRANLVRGSQESDPSLPSSGPLNSAQPVQMTGPISGLLASAGAMPLLPGDTAAPVDRWAALNDRVATVLGNGTPTRETLEQLVGQVNDSPPAASPIVLTGGPGTPPIAPPTPLPPPIYEGINKASPN